MTFLWDWQIQTQRQLIICLNPLTQNLCMFSKLQQCTLFLIKTFHLHNTRQISPSSISLYLYMVLALLAFCITLLPLLVLYLLYYNFLQDSFLQCYSFSVILYYCTFKTPFYTSLNYTYFYSFAKCSHPKHLTIPFS